MQLNTKCAVLTEFCAAEKAFMWLCAVKKCGLSLLYTT